jgi:hypothetical protein
MKFLPALSLAAVVAFAVPADAAPKQKGQKVRGLLCVHYQYNKFFPISQLKPELRRSLRLGQVVKFTLPEIGAISCKVQ